MKLAAAQLCPEKGNIEANIIIHCDVAKNAARHQCDFIVFSELSLSGYEPALAQQSALRTNSTILAPLQETADRENIAICVGLPLVSEQEPSDGIEIGMFLFRPKEKTLKYAKQLLHQDEKPFFVAGQSHTIFSYHQHRLAPAICYESVQSSHACAAAQRNSDIYLASVAKPETAIAHAYSHYCEIASRHRMMVMMTNSIGPCDNFVAAGQSAIWAATGERLVSLNATQKALLIFDTETHAHSVVDL